MIRLAGGIVAISLALLGVGSAQALTLQPVGDFDQPIYVTSDPSDASRLLIAEREGTIRLVEGGAAPTLFANLTTDVQCEGSCQGERGLMSIALSPQFQSDGRVFAFYAHDVSGELRIVELLSSGPNHDTAAFSGNVLTIPHPGQSNHNGGQLQFGPDGGLFASTGDGGGQNDPGNNAQDPGDRLGKILRVNHNSTDDAQIWSLGLRNPFRFSFDRLSGDMVIGDVGQAAREEIDYAPSPAPGAVGGQNANYGWDCREGLLPGAGPSPACALTPPTAFVDPVFEYPQTPDPDFGGADRCAVTGGYVARDPGLGALYGNYVYADYCAGVLRALRLPASPGGPASGDCSLGLRVENPVSFGEDAAARLYVVEQGGGVHRLAGLPPSDCPVPLPQPQPPLAGPLKPTIVGIKAQRRRVERGKTAVLTLWVSPCQGRKGDPIALLRNGRRNGSKFLSRACTARFMRRVRRGTTFAAFTYAEDGYQAADSRKLRIRIVPRRAVRPR